LPPDRVKYRKAGALKSALLSRAWERFRAGGGGRRRAGPFDAFLATQTHWLDDFATFMALRDANGTSDWPQWPREIVRRQSAAMREARTVLADEIRRQQFSQFLFRRQLQALRRYARPRGVSLIGDLPIFVSADSADVWANPHLFQLDRSHRPRAVAGVPPDYFSRTGQRWGNPLYDWEAMRRDGFAWWVARARATLDQVDLVRIDHFRGFEAYWQIPARLPTAERGRWVKAPGRGLFVALRKQLGRLPFIAEDLGLITPEVESLRDQFGLPGMRVLQFAFGGGGADNPFLPHNYVPNAVAYTGTHDNDTTPGWFARLDRKGRAAVRDYAPDGQLNGKWDPAWALIRLAWSSVAHTAVAPLQDVLGLGSKARMNTPGTGTGNWRWRFQEGMLREDRLDQLGELTATYGRA
jgi:4-alpha-glucanotransferase